MKLPWRSSGVDDKPATEDLLQITAYTEALTEFIRNCAMPMTIAVQGSWGAGKTTVMNLVRKKLENPENQGNQKDAPKPENPVKTAWFNTWQYSQFEMDDRLSFSLLEYLSKACAPNQQSDIRNDLKALLSHVSVELSPPGKGMTLKLNGAGAEEMDYIQAIESLKEKLDALIKNALGIGKSETEADKAKRLVMFIDDLDRLNPQKAVEVLEVLKLFLENDHCVFVLAIDYDVIVRGVEAKYGDTNGKANLDARKFFDKIIQVPFRLPVANYQISNLVLQCLKGIYPKTEEEKRKEEEKKKGKKKEELETLEKDYEARLKPIADSYVRLIQLSIGGNPRSVKRLLNAFQLQLYAMRSFDANDEAAKSLLEKLKKLKNLEETRKKLLFALCCLQLYSEEMYDVIARRLNGNAGLKGFLSNLRAIGEGTESEMDDVAFDDGQDFFQEMIDILDKAAKGEASLQFELLKSVINASGVTVSEASDDKRPIWEGEFDIEHVMMPSEKYHIMLGSDYHFGWGKPVRVQWEDEESITARTHSQSRKPGARQQPGRIDGLGNFLSKRGLTVKEKGEKTVRIRYKPASPGETPLLKFTLADNPDAEKEGEQGKEGGVQT